MAAAATPSLCDWLQRQTSAARTSVAPSAVATAVTADDAAGMAAEAQRIAAMMLAGAAALHEDVLRDGVYVHCTRDDVAGGATTTAPSHYTHAVLDALAHAANSHCKRNTTADDAAGVGVVDRTAYKHALLRYASLAHSLHPYTVFALLRAALGDDDDDDDDSSSSSGEGSGHDSADDEGLVLALAALLARKAELQLGGLQRLPGFVAVANAIFVTAHTTSDVSAAAMRRRRRRVRRLYRFAAVLCRVTCTAVVVGSLDAACLLAVLADAAVTRLYSGTAVETDNSSSSSSSLVDAVMTEHLHDVIESLTFLSSYVQWGLQGAAPALGVLSAHVGSAYAQTKEAALRAGGAHTIALTRAVDIVPLSVARQVASTTHTTAAVEPSH